MKKKLIKLSTALLATAVLFTTSCKKEVQSVFSASKSTAEVGEPIVFNDGGEANQKNLTYSYDFGDGSAVVTGVKNPSHAYEKAGTYTVSQFVSKNRNLENGKIKIGTSTVTITITCATADFTASTSTPNQNELVTLTNTTTGDDGLGYPVSYTWKVTGNGTTTSLGSDKNVIWKPTAVGVYVIELTAEQGYSKTKKAMDSVTVGGSSLSPAEFQGFLAGTWDSILVSGVHTSAAYGGANCYGVTPTTTADYLSLEFDGNGSSTYGIKTNTPTLFSNAGGISIVFAATGYVNLTGGSSLGTTDAASGNGNLSGLYQIIGTPTRTSIVLRRTVEGTTCSGLAYTDVYTVTLSR